MSSFGVRPIYPFMRQRKATSCGATESGESCSRQQRTSSGTHKKGPHYILNQHISIQAAHEGIYPFKASHLPHGNTHIYTQSLLVRQHNGFPRHVYVQIMRISVLYTPSDCDSNLCQRDRGPDRCRKKYYSRGVRQLNIANKEAAPRSEAARPPTFLVPDKVLDCGKAGETAVRRRRIRFKRQP